jgi:hypothetical protein
MRAELRLLRRHVLRLLMLIVIGLIGAVVAAIAPHPELRVGGCLLFGRGALAVIAWVSRSMSK